MFFLIFTIGTLTAQARPVPTANEDCPACQAAERLEDPFDLCSLTVTDDRGRRVSGFFHVIEKSTAGKVYSAEVGGYTARLFNNDGRLMEIHEFELTNAIQYRFWLNQQDRLRVDRERAQQEFNANQAQRRADLLADEERSPKFKKFYDEMLAEVDRRTFNDSYYHQDWHPLTFQVLFAFEVAKEGVSPPMISCSAEPSCAEADLGSEQKIFAHFVNHQTGMFTQTETPLRAEQLSSTGHPVVSCAPMY